MTPNNPAPGILAG